MNSTTAVPRPVPHSQRYRHGGDLERAAKKHLEANGYYVIKSAGSKGPVDLVALKRGEILVIQCKLDGYLEPAARMIFRSLALSVGATCLTARWHKEGRAARAVAFTELTSAGPAGHRPWTADHGLEAPPPPAACLHTERG